MSIIAIDPGNIESAYCHLKDGVPVEFGTLDNYDMIRKLNRGRLGDIHLVVETVACYGMAVGAEMFETCVWIGRFMQAWESTGGKCDRLYRQGIKLHLCGSPRAKDGNVRQALIDLYGGKANAIGNKKAPGPLHGMAGDEWAALAVAKAWEAGVRSKLRGVE